MRILDDPKDIAERIEHRRDADPLAHFLDTRSLRGPERNEPAESSLCLGHAPIGHRPTLAAGCTGDIRIEPQLITANIEAHIEWLIEVRLDPEDLGIPSLSLVQIGRMINDRPQSVKM